MISGVMYLLSGSFGGGAFGQLFAQWQAQGVFDYVLPFLLIFALTIGLLNKINIFGSATDPSKGRGINAIIALSVAFMSLQFNLVPLFFSEIFPRFGVALSIILVIIILGGLFMPTDPKNNWFMIALAIIVFIIIGTVIYNSLGTFGWSVGGPGWSFFWNQYGSIIIFAIIIIAIIAMTSPKKQAPKDFTFNNLLTKSMGQ